MTDITVAIFHRWFRITVGLFFIAVAIYYKEWMPALFGSMFIMLGLLNEGCQGACFVPRLRQAEKNAFTDLENKLYESKKVKYD